jgi:catechol 2,3-dioxygenase-like lactoylglutathione lyase family enzyme
MWPACELVSGKPEERAPGAVLRLTDFSQGVRRMILKPHVAIHVNNLEESIRFYSILFGKEPVKVKTGYAKFDLDAPALNFTLNEGGPVQGGINHFGIQVASTEDVLAAKQRLQEAGLASFDEMDTVCCYARQDKIWVTSPDGHRWEVFVVLEDVEEESRKESESCCELGKPKGETAASEGCECA